METIHNRMPVILQKETYSEWLTGDDNKALLEMLIPFPERKMKAYKVNEKVNSVKSEGPELIKPMTEQDLFSND